MKPHIFFPALLVLLGVVAGCGGPERKVLRGGTEHLPLLDGRVMQYQERRNGDVKPYSVEMRYAGGNRTRIFEVRFDGLDLGYCNFVSQDQRVFFSTDKPAAPMGSLPEYRELWVDETLEPGTQWTEEDTGVETVFAGFETVTVPAGTYPDCYKIVTTVSESYADTLLALRSRGEITADFMKTESARVGTFVARWFAPGVGLVKEQFNAAEPIRELMAIVKEGTGSAEVPADSVIEIDTLSQPQ